MQAYTVFGVHAVGEGVAQSLGLVQSSPETVPGVVKTLPVHEERGEDRLRRIGSRWVLRVRLARRRGGRRRQRPHSSCRRRSGSLRRGGGVDGRYCGGWRRVLQSGRRWVRKCPSSWRTRPRRRRKWRGRHLSRGFLLGGGGALLGVLRGRPAASSGTGSRAACSFTSPSAAAVVVPAAVPFPCVLVVSGAGADCCCCCGAGWRRRWW